MDSQRVDYMVETTPNILNNIADDERARCNRNFISANFQKCSRRIIRVRFNTMREMLASIEPSDYRLIELFQFFRRPIDL